MEYYTSAIEEEDLSSLLTEEILKICRDTLALQSEERRKAFALSREEGLSYDEIARAMGLTYARVSKDIHYVLKDLREALKDYLPSIAGAALLSFIC